MFEGYILQKVLPGKWLRLNVILWGMAVASTGTVENHCGLLEESMSSLSPSTGSLRLLPQECGI
jgi:hypothetical protein